jgi:hypothetical protein
MYRIDQVCVLVKPKKSFFKMVGYKGVDKKKIEKISFLIPKYEEAEVYLNKNKNLIMQALWQESACITEIDLNKMAEKNITDLYEFEILKYVYAVYVNSSESNIAH